MKIFIFLLFILILLSCDDVKHRATINIQNKINCNIKIELYSKPNYTKNDMYKVSENGNGYNNKVFVIRAAENTYISDQEIFSTQNYTKLPSELVTEVFDSIKVIVLNKDSFELFFSGTLIRNYKFNMFTEDVKWKHETVTEYMETMVSSNETIAEKFTFSIDSMNFEKNN